MVAGSRLAESKDDMQMALAAVHISGRKIKVFTYKMIQLAMWGKQQRQSIQQARLTPGILANQHVVLLKH
ncbi:hypothetical protein HMPREF0201_01275 [Cedecea davisae DSM 4568]|uniref:Uncharacterized protein n=1 Tax=Cedecea davisae DSM 4568 TaxID=566551 RepID=S3J0J0_9ENTR|nr:hypothetical protein HMPREF0201_01275 [Cedecea davisae DSM 4568]